MSITLVVSISSFHKHTTMSALLKYVVSEDCHSLYYFIDPFSERIHLLTLSYGPEKRKLLRELNCVSVSPPSEPLRNSQHYYRTIYALQAYALS